MKLFAKGQGAIIKIISLAIGLTVGLVLIAKVQLERNYDNCTVDKERVYELQEAFQRQGEEMKEYPATPGGIAPVLVQNIPEIEVGTRYTGQFEEEKLTLENGSRHYFQQAMFADSCFFDIFETKVIQGDARKILSSAGQCLIS
jgi:putative ABC transport system permease protein